jgi:hypothetical protein
MMFRIMHSSCAIYVHFDISFATDRSRLNDGQPDNYADRNSSLRQPADTGTCNLSLDLLAEDVLESNGISGEFRDTLTELLNGHLVLVEEKAELSLVVDVALLLDVEVVGVFSVKLLGNGVLRVVELLK